MVEIVDLIVVVVAGSVPDVVPMVMVSKGSVAVVEVSV